MATAPWWWVPLITVIGTPLLGALLYFFVPLLRVAKRLGRWLSNPPWWVQNIFAALLVGVIVASVSILWQKRISDASATEATRLENLRFVRQLSSESKGSRPFGGLDLQGQNLSGLDLKGADFSGADLQHAALVHSDLASTPTHVTDLRVADLTGADLILATLTGAHLDGADLTRATLIGAYLKRAHLDGVHLKGVYYDDKTEWPEGFKPPPCGQDVCVLGRGP